MSKKFTGFHHGTRRVWTNTMLTLETEVVFNRDICITDVSFVGSLARTHFAIADNTTRRILAYASYISAGDVKTKLTVVGGGRLILEGGKTYILCRWHADEGDIGWGNGLPSSPLTLGNGITATFTGVNASMSAPSMEFSASRNPANLTTLFVRDNYRRDEDGDLYSTIPYFWWEEVIVPPSRPSFTTVPTSTTIGKNERIEWSSVPFPTQPVGVSVPDPTVYYELVYVHDANDPYGEIYTIVSKSASTSVVYTIPPADNPSNFAAFAVRSFIEADGQRHYSDYRISAFITLNTNQRPSIPGQFTSPTDTSVFTIGRSYTVSWGIGLDPDGDPQTYDLEYFNGVEWLVVVRNSQSTTRTFHVPNGPDTSQARFRARAYDGKEYSPYRLSSVFRVESNVAPNMPKPFILPEPDELRFTQQAYRVEWGAASNNGTELYELQFRARQTENWTTIRNISHAQASTTSFMHTIPNANDSGNAQYRVRAYDGLDYGDWQESSFFKISGNHVTNTLGFNEEVKDRYGVGQEVALSWSAGSTARGSQVLYDFEIHDGIEWRELMYDIVDINIVFRIPNMSDTNYAKFRIRSKTRYDYGGWIYSDWLETRLFTVYGFFKFDNLVLPYPKDMQKKENVDYVRRHVNEMRVTNGLSPFIFTDTPIVRQETVIRNVHFDEIEEGILECYATNPNGRFTNLKTETEMKRVKIYDSQQELIMDLPQRYANILRALMNI